MAQNTFNVHLDSVQAGLRGTGSSIREVEGGYFLLGWQYADEHPSPAHLFTRLLDNQGRVTSQIEHGEGDARSYRAGGVDPLASMPDGTFMAAVAEGWSFGDSTWLYRFNAVGEHFGRHFLMSYPISDSTYHYFSNATPLSDGGLALCGTLGRSTGITRPLLVRLDATGQVAWVQDFPHAQHLACVREMGDGGLVATGYRTGTVDRSVLMRVSPSGNIEWIRYTGGLAYGGGVVRIDSDGSVISWGKIQSADMLPYSERWVLTKRSSAGTTLWESSSVPYYSSFTTDMEVLPDGGFVAVGGKGSKGVMMRFGPEGQVSWTREYGILSSEHHFADVELTSDAGFILTGGAWRSMALDPDVLTHELTWAVRTDSMGCLVPGCHTVGIEEVALGLNEYLRISPNPVARGHELRIAFEPPAGFTANEPLRVKLLDASGRMVHEEVIRGQTHNLSTSNLSTGLHYLHLTDGTRWLAGGKVVVE
jgi:hypothetical protein